MLSLSFRSLLAVCAVATALALVVGDAQARAGRGGSFGSRGSQTFSAPPSTATSPSARPIERSMTQPGQPGTFSQRPISETGIDRTFAVECAVVVAALIVTILGIEKLRAIASHLPD